MELDATELAMPCLSFDRVPHARLERKLKSHGTGGDVSDWIMKWLTESMGRIIYGHP